MDRDIFLFLFLFLSNDTTILRINFNPNFSNIEKVVFFFFRRKIKDSFFWNLSIYFHSINNYKTNRFTLLDISSLILTLTSQYEMYTRSIYTCACVLLDINIRTWLWHTRECMDCTSIPSFDFSLMRFTGGASINEEDFPSGSHLIDSRARIRSFDSTYN